MMCRAIPYKGQEPYIFVSYCHEDADRVYPLLEQLVRDGHRVWYDEGDHSSQNWRENIIAHLRNSRVCIAMISENTAGNHECRGEISDAFEAGKKLQAVLLGDFVTSPGLRLQLNEIHPLKRKDYPSEYMLLQKLYEAEEMKACRGEPGKLPMRAGPSVKIVHLSSDEPAVWSAPNPVVKPDPNPVVKPEPNPGVKPEPNPEVKPEPNPEVKPEPNPGVKPEPNPGVKPEPNPEVKPEPNPEVKLEPNPEVKLEPEPGPKPQTDPDDEKTIYIKPRKPDADDGDDGRTMIGEKPKTIVLLRSRDSSGYVLNRAPVRIGRSEKSDVVLRDNECISKTHVEISQFKGVCYLMDAGSTNGTFISDERLDSKKLVRLESPAIFRLYDEQFMLLYGPEADAIAARETVCLLRNVNTQNIIFLKNDRTDLVRRNLGGDKAIGREKHAVLRRKNEKFFLEDRDHANGVYLNKRALGRYEICPIKTGDRIELGNTTLEVWIAVLQGEKKHE